MARSAINLVKWGTASDSPLHSDNSDDGSPEQYGDLTITDPSNCDLEECTGINTDTKEDEVCGDLLRHLANRYNDFTCAEKIRYRFSCLTELDVTEQYAEPPIVRMTTPCSLWPCDVMGEIWFQTRVFFARTCNWTCCQKYTCPQVLARHRRFTIVKKAYLSVPGLTSSEMNSVLGWSDLVSIPEWQEGNWNERGVLLISDASTFHTKRVSWNVMEEHLATLANSDKKSLVLLAARICMETLARNKAFYTYSQQFWEFAGICVQLLKCQYPEVQEGILLSLLLYLRTLKLYYCCFSYKCAEYVSAGLFPVLFSLLETTAPNTQALIVNILILMITHAPYINMIVNLGGVTALIRLCDTNCILLKRRVYACLEVMSRHDPAHAHLIQEGILPLAVRHLQDSKSHGLRLSCLFILNSLCLNKNTLVNILSVDNYLVVKAAMETLADCAKNKSQNSRGGFKTSVLDHSHSWCTLKRQNLILVCKLCVDDTACNLMVRQGLLVRLKVMWHTSDTETQQLLILEALAIMSRFSKPAMQICQEGFLSLFAEVLQDNQYQQQICNIILNLGEIYLTEMLETGLLGQMIACFENRLLRRELYPIVLSVLAAFVTNDKVRDLILIGEGKMFSVVLDIGFLTSDVSVQRSCVTILSRFDITAIPFHLLKQNTVQLVTYVVKILKTGPDGLVLYGLMQLQDYLQVDFLVKAFRDHHINLVLEALCHPPHTPPVQLLAGQILETLTVSRSRRSSMRSNEGDTHLSRRDDVYD